MSQVDRAIIDMFLTNHSNGLFNDTNDFIAERILPAVPVKETTGKVPNYGTDHLRIVNTSHIGKGGYLEVDTITRGSDTYDIQDHGLTTTVTQREKDNVQRPYDALIDATTVLTSMQMLAKEKALADSLQDPTIITQGTTLSGNSQYDKKDHADSDPIEDSLTAKETIRSACGRKPNTIITSDTVADRLRVHSQLLDALGFKESRPGGLTDQELARALGVDQILIGSAVYETAKQGQTSSLADIWAKDLIYAVIAPRIELRQKTLGIEVRKNAKAPRRVRRWNLNEPEGATKVNVLDDYDQLILNAECAYLIQDAVA